MSYKEIKKFKSKILDVKMNEIYPAEVTIEKEHFKSVVPLSTDFDNDSELDFEGILVPGFIDAHIHIESSLLTPTNFAKAVVPFGTTSVIADPHEIANVSGIEGVEFLIKDASYVPFDFYFSAPSCVPATEFETTGASLDSGDIEELMKKDEVIALGEVMNFVGVINRDSKVIDKLIIAKKYNKAIDGHAPMLSGENLEKYVNAFDDNRINDVNDEDYVNDVNEDIDIVKCIISTDHECVSFDEAIEKKKLGMKIMVREGSSAKNMESLFNISDRISLCSNQDFFGSVSVDDFENVLKNPIFDFLVSDDKHPNDLKEGHLNILIKKAIGFGIDPIEAIKMVTINPAQHYNLNSGAIETGKRANFVLIDNFDDFNIKKTFIAGKLIAEDGKSFIKTRVPVFKDTFKLSKKVSEDFNVFANNHANHKKVRVIEAIDGEIITGEIELNLEVKDGLVQEDIDKDILKLAVVERYGHDNVANGFIKGFGLKKGAIASSVAHDSHNVIVLGTNAPDMARVVNLIHENKGGLAIVFDNNERILPLPIAGLMSDKDVFTISNELENIYHTVKGLGCTLKSPFMTLSFMALLVIPKLRLSDRGLFDVDKFSFVDLIK